MKTYKIVINITGNLGIDAGGNERFMESLKAKFVDHLPYQKGECEVTLVSIQEEDE